MYISALLHSSKRCYNLLVPLADLSNLQNGLLLLRTIIAATEYTTSGLSMAVYKKSVFELRTGNSSTWNTDRSPLEGCQKTDIRVFSIVYCISSTNFLPPSSAWICTLANEAGKWVFSLVKYVVECCRHYLLLLSKRSGQWEQEITYRISFQHQLVVWIILNSLINWRKSTFLSSASCGQHWRGSDFPYQEDISAREICLFLGLHYQFRWIALVDENHALWSKKGSEFLI